MKHFSSLLTLFPKWIVLGIKLCVVSFVFLILSFFVYDFFSPVDLNARTHTVSVLAQDGRVLRVFSDQQGVVRQPISINDVDKKYIEALVNYEDRYFYEHFGVNPFSLIRAAFQWVNNKKIISGGSTLTMQVARVRYPKPRSIKSKFFQLIQALQLELHFSKDEILQYYINYAPFGGPIEGVQAASEKYFSHDATSLSYSEAALLAVLPQAPSYYRPDRYPEKSKQARNKVLDRLLQFSIWSEQDVNEAKDELIFDFYQKKPMLAAVYARELKNKFPKESVIHTSINYDWQESLEELARDYASNLPSKMSLAILVLDNQTGLIKSYVPSADFTNTERFSHVNMITATRSPGSTLKPFIYAKALDKGLLHSKSLLQDVPINFSGYMPVNFHRSFSGAVPMDQALKDSLNVTSIQVLDHVGAFEFYTWLVNAGLNLSLPNSAKPNLSIGLGGVGSDLLSLTQTYTALARGGNLIKARINEDESKLEQNIMSKGAAYIIYDSLLDKYSNSSFAIKTGTSYGFRDAWSIGFNKNYTVGVWVGRPDGATETGYFGSSIAKPLLQQITQQIQNYDTRAGKLIQPDSVSKQEICWPMGTSINMNTDSQCQQVYKALTLNQTMPHTLSEKKHSQLSQAQEIEVEVSKATNFSIPNHCFLDDFVYKIKTALWPVKLEPWLDQENKTQTLIPKKDPRCNAVAFDSLTTAVKITGLKDKDKIARNLTDHKFPSIKLKAQGGVDQWYWFVNSKFVHKGKQLIFAPEKIGEYQITVTDQSASVDLITISVE